MNNNNGDDQLGAVSSSSFSYSSSSSSPSSCYGLSSRNGDDQIHVLAVDDNLIDRILVEKLLKNSACKVTTAENAMRALEYLGLGEDQQNNSKVTKVNLILTDYCMPGMTGYDLLKKIKESSHMKEVPVVIMSSENVPTRISKCLEEGAQMFMLKPLKLSDIKKMRCQVMQCGHY